ncbi:TadE/TadG family type IV pilus assembly protein [Bradyrhizobium manausense]|uniref:TadE/TadG family type IV pilus assembly protein n=1 Tax=Bradyrhizobium manausense TaxID=989370 RepID=UPI002010CF1B|nr:TadE family protein [Bradyrhizobium manausense]
MRKLDQRGAAAFEFCLVGMFFFTLMFVIFDLGRYAITVQSLRALADAGARAIMINCYTDAAIQRQSPTGCSGDPLSASQKQAIAPFLFNGGLSPTLSASGSSPIVVTASQPSFTMFMPIWGTTFNAPSAATKIPSPV